MGKEIYTKVLATLQSSNKISKEKYDKIIKLKDINTSLFVELIKAEVRK